MFMITNLIELRREKLILNHLIGNNCPEFPNGLLDSYFFKLNLGSDCSELCFCNLLSKPYRLINITKIPVAFKLKSGIENISGGIKAGENDQPKELSNANNGFIHDDNEGENFDDGKHCKY